MKKTLKVLGFVLALMLVAAACGDSGTTTTEAPQPPATDAPTTTQPPATTPPTTMAPTTTQPPSTEPPAEDALLIWADETREPILKDVAADFTAATGVPVEIQLVGFGDIRNNMVQQAPVGEGADVFIGAHDWIGELAVNGVVEPFDLGARASEFFPIAVEAVSFEGQTYGVPYAIEAIGLYRNTELVPEAPADWADLLATCDALSDTVDQCIALPAGGDFYHHYPFFASKGGYLFAFDETAGYDPNDRGIDTPEAIAGFEFFNGLVADGTLNPAVDYGTMTDLFFNGNAAFMWTGPWALPDVQNAGVPYATSKLPAIEGSTAVPFVGVQAFFVNAFSEQKALAQTFVAEFVATEDVMVQLFEAGQRAPAHIAAFNQVADDPDVVAFGASAEDGQPMPNIPEMSAVWGSLGNAVQEVYNQSSDVTTILTNAAQGVTDALAG